MVRMLGFCSLFVPWPNLPEKVPDESRRINILQTTPTLFVCDFVAVVIASVVKHQQDFPAIKRVCWDTTDGRLLDM